MNTERKETNSQLGNRERDESTYVRRFPECYVLLWVIAPFKRKGFRVLFDSREIRS